MTRNFSAMITADRPDPHYTYDYELGLNQSRPISPDRRDPYHASQIIPTEDKVLQRLIDFGLDNDTKDDLE